MAYKKRLSKKLFRCLFILFYIGVSYALFSRESIPELTLQAPISIYANQLGDDLKKVTREAILRAEKSITLLIYSLTDSDMIELFNARARDGIKILIVHDKEATPDIGFKLHDSIRIAPYKARGLMHDKILIIDTKEVWFGSTNFTRDSFTLHANQIIGILSEEFAKAAERRAEEMFLAHRCKSTPLLLKTQNQTLQFFFLPESEQALEKLLHTIDTAKKSCRVAMYTFTHPKLTSALIDAKNRGVSVEVVIDAESSRQTSRIAYERLKREKVPVFRSKRTGLLHHKMAIIDDALVTGSANWTKAAFQYNDDCIAFLSPLSEKEQEKLNRLWKAIRYESK